MKFLSLIQFLLSNQSGQIGFGPRYPVMSAAEDLSGGGGGDFGDSGEWGDTDSSSDDSFGMDEPSDEQIFKDFGLDHKKYGNWEEEKPESKEENPQGSEEVQDAGQDTDEKSFIERINSLGMIHAENPLKVESIDEVKNLVQMGKDYTVKTQALSEERKVFETERDAAQNELNQAIDSFNQQYKELEGQIQELQQWQFALKELEAKDPDLFSEVQRTYSEIGNRFKNPIVEQQLAAMRAELAETKKGLAQRESKAVVDEFERDKAAMSATEQSMKELGVNVDWNKVKAEWKETGLPLNKVVGSMYFDQVTKAQASKAKVETTARKVAAKPTGGASAARPGSKEKAIDPKLKGLSLGLALWDKYKS
jgi:hypothetical protein